MAASGSVRQRLSVNIVDEEDGSEFGTNIGAAQPASQTATSEWRTLAENILWLAAALFILVYGDSRTDFLTLIFTDPRIRRLPFNLALACLVVNTGIFLYLAIWLRHVFKNSANWDVVAPHAIPTATIVGVVATFLFSLALWPVWSFLTLPLLFTLFMAFVIVASYLPPYVKSDSPSLRSKPAGKL